MSNIRSLNTQPTFWDFVSDFDARSNQGASDNARRSRQSTDTFYTEDTLSPDDVEMGGGTKHPESRHERDAPPHDDSPHEGPSRDGPPPPPRGHGPHHDERTRSRSPRGHRHGRHGMRHHPHGPPHGHGHPGPHGGPFGRGGFRGRGGGCWRGRGGMGGFGHRGPFGGEHPWAAAFSGRQGPFSMEQLGEYFNAATALFNQNFNTARDGDADGESDQFRPAVDVFDTPASYVVHVSLPGAKKDDVVVNWKADKQELEIAGVVYRPGVDEEMTSMLELGEREVGMFTRTVKLGSQEKPAGVDEEGISAKLEDGVLRIDVPKLKEAEFVQVRKVDVL